MRKLPTILRFALSLSLGALLLGGVGCSRLTGSGDDSKPSATAAATAMPAPSATAAAAATVLAPGVYTVNKPVDTDPGAVVTTVTIEADATKLEFSFTNHGKQTGALMLAKPGSREAFFLEQPDGKKISLRSSSGIAVLPAKTMVPPGDTLKFTAVFGPLDPGVRKFSLYEGEDAKKTMPGETTYWVLHDLEIK